MGDASDTRIPILFGAQAENGDAFLAEDGGEPIITGFVERFTLPTANFGHAQGCSCCIPRGPAAEALGRMFLARATGAAPFFKRVIIHASAAGEAAVRDAIGGDVMTAARYRLPD